MKLTSNQSTALNEFATRYKIPIEALEVKRLYGKYKGCIKGSIVLESRIDGMEGLFEHSVIINTAGWVKLQKTKIIG